MRTGRLRLRSCDEYDKEVTIYIENMHVYIISNISNSVVYIGSSSDLVGRIYTHKTKTIRGFSSKYNLTKLVYFEDCETAENMVVRERQLKGWLRARKDALIDRMNPNRIDLYHEIIR